MTVITKLRPGPDEYPASLSDYVDGIGEHEDILAVLTGQLDRVLAWLGAQAEERGDHRYAAGKWSIKEIVAHLCDTERVFAYRALRIGRGDSTPLPGFDDQSYVPEVRAGDRTLADMAAEWSAVRQASIALFRHFPAVAWERRGMASDNPISVRALAYIIAGHVRHHLEVLEERYTE